MNNGILLYAYAKVIKHKTIKLILLLSLYHHKPGKILNGSQQLSILFRSNANLIYASMKAHSPGRVVNLLTIRVL